MWNGKQKETLLDVCRKHCYQNAPNCLVPEAYLPYMPENWNGILILAEAQTPYPNYWEKLKDLDAIGRMTRLGRKELQFKETDIGIGPWDNGTIKLALQAIFNGAKIGLKLEDVAVSNAVPWTKKTTGKNVTPDDEMQAKAAEFWKDIFDVWNPDLKVLVVLGNTAERVMRKAGILKNKKFEKKWLKLRLPSPMGIKRVSGMFSCDDLKARFPEVQKALDTLKINKEEYNMKVFFACHAVSLGVPEFKEWFGGVK